MDALPSSWPAQSPRPQLAPGHRSEIRPAERSLCLKGPPLCGADCPRSRTLRGIQACHSTLFKAKPHVSEGRSERRERCRRAPARELVGSGLRHPSKRCRANLPTLGADKTIAIMSFDKRASSGMLHSSTSEIMRPAPAARLNSPLGSLGAWERNIEYPQRYRNGARPTRSKMRWPRSRLAGSRQTFLLSGRWPLGRGSAGYRAAHWNAANSDELSSRPRRGVWG
jgi:hypothetical protein